MFIVQKFHSIHEIDPEFIQTVETLLQEEVASFDILVHNHDKAPSTDVFTYFLFFGPTQNAPVGFAQLCLRQIPSKEFLTWQQKLRFWDKDHLHWKQLTWQVGDGSSGMCVFDPRFARTGKEKLQELIKEYEARPDILAENLFCLKGLQDFQAGWREPMKSSKETYVLEPLPKSHKTYQDYLMGLEASDKNQIKESWKGLHKGAEIELGDYQSALDTPKTLPIPEDQLKLWSKWGAQVLTFEKGMKVLGCLLVLKGRNGNVFFEPFPFEPEGQSLVNDDLYIQYALLKFYEMPEARKCHIMKFGSKLMFEQRGDLDFFVAQGFKVKTVTQSFFSRLEGLNRPV